MRLWLTILIVLALVGLARRFGAGPERSAAALLAGNLAISILSTVLRGRMHFDGIDPILFTIDFATFLGLTWIALQANRMWPLVLSALHLILLIAHLSVLISIGNRRVYWGMMALPQYFEILVLAMGIAAHRARVLRYGRYRCWRRSERVVYAARRMPVTAQVV